MNAPVELFELRWGRERLVLSAVNYSETSDDYAPFTRVDVDNAVVSTTTTTYVVNILFSPAAHEARILKTTRTHREDAVADPRQHRCYNHQQQDCSPYCNSRDQD